MDQDQEPPRSTHFGYRTVETAQKQSLVHDVFATVASRYDLMNDVMSGGVHRIWKDIMVTAARPRPGQTVLDVAGGTGDIAFRLLDQTEKTGLPGPMIVADINAAMLREGQARADRRHDEGKPVPRAWVCGNAEHLPLPDRSVDLYTIAFGIRNVTHIDHALAEAHRVLRFGGRFVCLEFSHVDVPGLDAAYDAFSFHVIPRMGAAVAGDRESYQYLVESIRRFPDQKRFTRMIEDAGFANAEFRNLSGGIAALHTGWKV